MTEDRNIEFSQEVLHAIQDLFFVLDRDFRILYRNRLFTSVFTGEQGRTCWQTIKGQDSPCAECPVREVFRTGTSARGSDIELDDGRCFSVSAWPVLDSSGKTVRVVEQFHDITRERKLERELRDIRSNLEESVNRRTAELEVYNTELELQNAELLQIQEDLETSRNNYRSLFDESPLGYFILDKKGVVLDLNQQGARMLKAKVDFLRDRPFIGLVEPASHAIFYGFLRSCFNVPGSREAEIRLLRRDWISLDVILHSENARDNPAQLRVAVMDITARKSVEARVRAYRNFLIRVIDSVSEPLVVKTSDLKFYLVNSIFCKMMNKTPEQIIGRTSADLIDKKLAASMDGWEQEALETGNLIEREFHLQDANDNTIHIIWHSQRYVDPQGQVYLVNTATDISAKVNHMNRITRLNESLKEKQDKLITANRELDAFSHSVSHDLRSPLQVIRQYTELLMKSAAGRLNEEEHFFGQSVLTSVDRMNGLINDLLRLSRMGRKSLQPRQFEMKELILGVLREIPLPDHVDLEISDFPSVYADPSMLKQVWINLLSNAIKYSSREPLPRIRLFTRQEGDTHWFCISDNGVGFDMTQSPKLFQTFSRLHSERDFKGTGIGLAIVKRIIRRHQGIVQAFSEPGNGATFSFSLGLVSGNVEHAAPQPSTEIATTQLESEYDQDSVD